MFAEKNLKQKKFSTESIEWAPVEWNIKEGFP
jgi:hypothetical protein